MAIKFLTVKKHQHVLSRLLAVGRSVNGAATYAADPEYLSLMVCFLMHEMSAAESILCLYQSFSVEWFPATVGYLIARSMFETDVTAHYISQQSSDRVHRYILFEHILNKSEMDTCARQRAAKIPSGVKLWTRCGNINGRRGNKRSTLRYDEVRRHFESAGKSGRARAYRNWSGKNIREMAVEVAHEEAYDVFYAELSSFTHADIQLANRFLRLGTGGMSWSQRAREFDVGNVLRHAASFSDLLPGALFGRQIGAWDQRTVNACWNVEDT